MPTNTHVALDKVTISNTTTNSVTFTGISGSYTDLQLVINGYTITGSGAFVALRFNSDTASNYSTTYMWGNGTSATSARQTSQTSSTIGAFYSTQATIIANVQNYSNSTTYKPAISRSNSSADNVGAFSSIWRSTAAITSMTVLTTGGEYFNNGCTFSLYGILKEGSGDSTPKAVGGVVTSDATYYYHTFATSSNFIPNQTLTCDYLIVGGGGGGGPIIGGGGGAGGYRPFSSASITAGTYPVVIGAGGNGGAYGGLSGGLKAAGTAGNASTFNGYSAAGGGRGAYFADGSFYGPATSGGSGGGGSRNQAAGSGNTPSTSPVQGYAGGSGYDSPYYTAGGGGGAGGAGSNAGSDSGNGGAGLNWQSLGTYYAGGGGAARGDTGIDGVGGIGGGGNGYPGVGLPGSYATGGGGGGGHSTGGAGGGGVVIIRYAKA